MCLNWNSATTKEFEWWIDMLKFEDCSKFVINLKMYYALQGKYQMLL